MSHDLLRHLLESLAPGSPARPGQGPAPQATPISAGHGSAPAAFPVLDAIRVQALIYEEMRRIRDLLIDARRPLGGPPPASGGASAQGACGDELLEELRHVQAVLLKHPVATQAAFSALVAEGRRFAATPEGAAWATALAQSTLAQQGRRLWEALTFNMMEADPAAQVPSVYLETLLRAVSSPDLGQLLQRLLGELGHADAPAR